jgi:hypothetical protein
MAKDDADPDAEKAKKDLALKQVGLAMESLRNVLRSNAGKLGKQQTAREQPRQESRQSKAWWRTVAVAFPARVGVGMHRPLQAALLLAQAEGEPGDAAFGPAGTCTSVPNPRALLCARSRNRAVGAQVIGTVAANKDCVKNIADSAVLVYLLFTTVTLARGEALGHPLPATLCPRCRL